MAKKEINKEKKHFWKDFKAELKKVIWPTPKQLVNNTSVVVALVLITALIVFVLDLAFDSANKYGVAKLQASLQSTISSSNKDKEKEANDEEEIVEVENNAEENEKSETENVENTGSQETTESNE